MEIAQDVESSGQSSKDRHSRGDIGNYVSTKFFQINELLHAMRSIAFLLMIASCTTSAAVDLVRVDKSENRMYLMEGGKIVREYHVAFGANPKGHKSREGDERTPEGAYVLDYAKEDSAFYRAMHISYPNEPDIAKAEARGEPPGGYIMVHGQRNGLGLLAWITQRANWTDGCIALANSEMDEFMELVSVGTPIQIEW